ncbi:MAG TPA: rhodanese-like domain-containing protein [Gammaproteobacteria bacterium]|nr:rhodanese-like domain-containing protein [Gammaproteobacteria bacterium]
MTQQLTHFIINHWLLSGAFILVLILLLIEELRGKQGGNRLSPQDAVTLINNHRAGVVDIRDRESFDAGHIVNAIHIPQADLMTSLDKLKKYRDRAVLLTCNSGHNSQVMAAKLRKQGFSSVYSMAGGLQAWKAANLPLTKS